MKQFQQDRKQLIDEDLDAAAEGEELMIDEDFAYDNMDDIDEEEDGAEEEGEGDVRDRKDYDEGDDDMDVSD